MGDAFRPRRGFMDCCGSPAPQACAHERDQITWCANCAQILHVEPRTKRAPDASEYNRHLKKELAMSEDEAREAPWVSAKMVEYQTVSRLGGLLTLDIAPNSENALRPGDQVEFRGIDIRKPRHLPWSAVVVSATPAQVVVRLPANDGLARAIGLDWIQLEMKRADLSHLLRNQIKVYQQLLIDTDYAERLLEPADLPRIHRRADAHLPLLNALDPEAATNDEQAAAFTHALGTPKGGLALVQGPPGTGKTRLIANLVRAIVRAGGSVLVTAHTNVAVDNALDNILRLEPAMRGSMVRIGNPLKVSPAIQPLRQPWTAFPSAGDPVDPNADAFSTVFGSHPIVGTTLAMLASRMAARYSPSYRRFDYVLVDESSMNLVPPITCAWHAGQRLVLVGDHRQLPPIIQAPEFAARPGFCMSPFERIAWERPDLLARMTRQYRSLPGIMDWSNRALYDNKLETMREGAPPALEIDGQRDTGPCIWIETSRVEGNEHLVRSIGHTRSASFANPTQAAIAIHVIRALLGHGYEASEIGYISPFRLQAGLVHNLAAEHLQTREVEASTVDAYQGREKRVIIFDATTTTPQRSHDSIQRLNVALTRARDLLFVIGPRDATEGQDVSPYYYSLCRWFASRPTLDASRFTIEPELVADARAAFLSKPPALAR